MEAYGLVGFFAIVQGLITVFDLGISSSLTRSLSRNATSDSLSQESRDLAKTLETIYWGISFVIGMAIGIMSPFITSHWIKRVTLSEGQVSAALWLMAVSILFQFPVSFYTAGLVGLQRQVEQSILNLFLWIVRSLGVIPVILLADNRLSTFFLWQACLSVIASLCMRQTFWHYMPKTNNKTRVTFSAISKVWKFALSVSAVTVLLLVFNNLDKLYLSGRLNLDHYGFYVAAWQIASSLYLLYLPIYTAYYPVLVQLHSDEQESRFRQAFFRSSLLMSFLVVPTVVVIFVFAPQILQIWTNNPDVVSNATSIVRAFMPGALSGSLFYMLWAVAQARGQVQKLVPYPVFAIVLLVVLLPITFRFYGSLGVSIAWTSASMVLNLVMCFQVMGHSIKGGISYWLLHSVILPLAISSFVVTVGRLSFSWDYPRFYLSLALLLIWIVCLGVVAFLSPIGIYRSRSHHSHA